MDFIQRFLAFFKNANKGRLTRLIIFISIIIIIIVVTSTLLNQKSYSVLYSGMESADAGEVMNVLSEMGVDSKPRGDDTIMVETSQVDTIRMQLSAQGYPNSGFNFDIFQNASGLGSTDMEKEVYLQFQLQENIRRTIIRMDKVDDAVVNLNLSEESPFVLSDNNRPATAAVMLMLKNGQTIDNHEVRAIAELVSKSISGLQLQDVRIIDSKMNLYSIEDESDMQSVNTQINLQHDVQQKLKDQIINLLSPVFGEGKIIAEVNVVLDFDKQVTESVVFTPPVEGNTGIVISMKELSETIKNGAEGAAVAGIDANGAAPTYEATDADTDDAVYDKVSKETNMEINETKTLIENAKGTIKDLSVSVILDSSNSTVDYTENVRLLVSNAIGVIQDKITVEMLPFKKLENTEIALAFENQKEIVESVQRSDTMKYIIVGFAAVLVLILLSAIIRSLSGSSSVDYEEYEEYSDYQIKSDSKARGAAKGSSRGKAQGVNMVADEETIPGEEEDPEVEINFEKKDTVLSQLGNYVNKSPESVAQLLRKWLYEDYR
ncbi:MAG: flagellar M-ring protein FliF [Clostridiales bacterium]|nr:flagellar M-ring protein FliF [Clostridiales bacterium]